MIGIFSGIVSSLLFGIVVRSSTFTSFLVLPLCPAGRSQQQIQLHYLVIFVGKMCHISRFALRMQRSVRLLSLVGVHFKMLPENQELIMLPTDDCWPWS